MNGTKLEQLLVEIGGMELDALRELWRERFGAPPPLRSLPIMRMQLAWRVQAAACGGLDQETRRGLARTGAPQTEGRHLGLGATLTRNWKGRKVEVVVEENGFRWQNQLFPSLSAAATAIAGSRWNGPRFFGLREGSLRDLRDGSLRDRRLRDGGLRDGRLKDDGLRDDRVRDDA